MSRTRQQSTTDHRREALGLLILRVGLAWFLFVWAVNKILAPDQYVRIWGFFHGIDIGANMPYIMGSAQIIICLAIAAGIWRAATYALGFLMHGVTVVVIAASLVQPFIINDQGFPTNRNQAIALAALAGFAALWMLRHRDHWSFDAWWAGKKAKTE